MAVADIIILCAIAGFIIYGAVRGLIRELAALVGLVAGVLLALKFALPLATISPPQSWPLAVKTPLAGVIILLVTVILVNLLAHIFRKVLIRGALKGMDRFWGAVFGLVKALALILAAITALILTPLRDQARIWAQDTFLFKGGIMLMEPLAERCQEDFILAASQKFQKLLPLTAAGTGEKIQKEVAEFFGRIKEDASPDKIKERLQRLTPEAKNYLKSVIQQVKSAEEKGVDAAREIPAELRQVIKKIPLDNIGEELGLPQKTTSHEVDPS